MLSLIPKRILQIKPLPLCRYLNSSANFTLQYLINSCGFSQSAAISASQNIRFKSPKKPDAVLNLFAAYGFTLSQISTIITKLPRLLVADPQQTLMPKIDFLKSVGVSDVGLLLSKHPSILKRSLNNQIIPAFHFLNTILPTHLDVLLSFKRSTWIVDETNRTNMKTNLGILRELGVPQSNIIFLLKRPRSLMQPPLRFKDDIHRLKQSGFDPLARSFADALFRISGVPPSTLKGKSQVFRRWGWSDTDILSNFKKRPQIMMTSEKKINQVMDFVVNKMGWNSSDVLRWPNLFSFSFEERMVPRLLVIQLLLSKQLLSKKKVSLATVISFTEKQFLDKFVYKHKDHAPELLNLYRRKEGCTFTGLAMTTQSNGQNGIKIL